MRAWNEAAYLESVSCPGGPQPEPAMALPMEPVAAAGPPKALQHTTITARDERIAQREREIKFARITFELARMKAGQAIDPMI